MWCGREEGVFWKCSTHSDGGIKKFRLDHYPDVRDLQ